MAAIIKHPAAPDDGILMRALHRQSTPRRPIWLMRQAGRYLPEYRALRKEAGGFLPLAKNPHWAAEITLQPVRRFGLDAAIIFSDILTLPDAMGLELRFDEGEGPRLQKPLQSNSAVAALSPPPMEKLHYVFEACRLARLALPPEVPLIGFCGSPFTLACYMIDGAGGDFWHTRRMAHRRPDLLHKILAINTQAAAELLLGQIAAGCQVAMIFDSWGGLLGGAHYNTFSLHYIRAVVAAVRQSTSAKTVVFARQCGMHLPLLADCGCDALGVDWQMSLSVARRLTRDKVILQGNMDPAALLGDATAAMLEARRVLMEYGGGDGHIFNLGHGVDKQTPPDNVAAVAEAVRNFSLADLAAK